MNCIRGLKYFKSRGKIILTAFLFCVTLSRKSGKDLRGSGMTGFLIPTEDLGHLRVVGGDWDVDLR
jgi:hypothetical protein